MTDEPHPWRRHLDAGLAFEHAGLTDRALAAYGAAIAAAVIDVERAEAHVRRACAHRTRSEYEDARTHSALALELAQQCGSDDLSAEALNVDVGIHIVRGEIDDGERQAARALAVARSPRVRGITLQNMGTLAGRRGDLATARKRFDESIAAFREAKYELGLAYSLINAAMVAQDAGELKRALDIGDQAIAMSRSILAYDLVLTAVQNQSHVMVKLGWFEKAQDMLTEAFGFFTTARNPIRQAECLEIMGELNSMRDGDLAAAIRSFTLAKDLADRAGETILAERLQFKLNRLAR